MNGKKNLIPTNRRSKAEAAALGRKGGIASGVSKRKKKNLRQAFQVLAGLPCIDKKAKKLLRCAGLQDDEMTNAAALAVSVFHHAINGNSQMARLAVEMMGEDPALELKREELKLKREAMEEGEPNTMQTNTMQIFVDALSKAWDDTKIGGDD